MALYFGSVRLDFNNSSVHYNVNTHTIKPKMKSSDGYIMTDEDGVYITLKEDNNLQQYITNDEQK